jgi:aminopeptidase
MTDPRLARMARTIVDYSLALKPGDLLRIEASALTQPLVAAAFAEAMRAGANVLTRISLDGIGESFLRLASDDQLAYISESERVETETVTARLAIGGGWNNRSLSGVNPDRLAIQRKARAPIAERMLQRRLKGELRWCITQYPTQASAQDAEMSLEEYESFVFGACFADRDDPVLEWQRLSSTQGVLVERLNRVKKLRVEAADTELELSVRDRRWINSDGKANFPSGEVFSAPVEDSVNGRIRFEFPAVYSGRMVTGISLEIKDGRVTGAQADTGEDFLEATIATDAGAARLGEVAFGTNPGIQRFTRNILFDEKIGGTMHFALGNAYPECGGSNKSAIHWDLIKDLRTEGRVFADGELIYENGRFK